MVPGRDEPMRAAHTTGSPRHEFPDDARTYRSHAGEALEDSRNWPGMILAGIGIVALGLTLTAAGYGFEGWALIAGIAAAVCLGLGGFLIVAEHRRVKAREGRALGEQQGH